MSRTAAALLLGCTTACAQIRSTTTSEVVPKPGARARRIGAPQGEVVARGIRLSWRQEIDAVRFEVFETRRCREVLHQPVVRIDRIDRRPDAAIYWEYILGAALVAVGIVGLAAPEKLSGNRVSFEGDVYRDTRQGYRLGGIFGGIGLALLGGGIYDSFRTRDEVRYADAYRVVRGDVTACIPAEVPYAERDLELLVGSYSAGKLTDREGRSTLLLPTESALETLWEEQPGKDRLAPGLRKGVLRVDGGQAVAFDFRVPYEATFTTPHEGRAELTPR